MVAIFEEPSTHELQREINGWVEKHGIKIISVQYQAFYNQEEGREVYTALVVYSG